MKDERLADKHSQLRRAVEILENPPDILKDPLEVYELSIQIGRNLRQQGYLPNAQGFLLFALATLDGLQQGYAFFDGTKRANSSLEGASSEKYLEIEAKIPLIARVALGKEWEEQVASLLHGLRQHRPDSSLDDELMEEKKLDKVAYFKKVEDIIRAVISLAPEAGLAFSWINGYEMEPASKCLIPNGAIGLEVERDVPGSLQTVKAMTFVGSIIVGRLEIPGDEFTFSCDYKARCQDRVEQLIEVVHQNFNLYLVNEFGAFDPQLSWIRQFGLGYDIARSPLPELEFDETPATESNRRDFFDLRPILDDLVPEGERRAREARRAAHDKRYSNKRF